MLLKRLQGGIYIKNFNLMIIGQIISLFGANILKFVLSLYILDLTGSADVFATVLSISILPSILFLPIGGVIADRFNRRNLMVIFDFSSSLIILALIIIFLYSQISVLLICIVMTLLSIISSMYQPTVQASIPLLLGEKELMKGNGIVSGVNALTVIISPILGGLLYSFAGFKIILIISCISFFLSAIMEIFIKIPFIKKPFDGKIISLVFIDLKEGLNYILKENRFILKIMILAALLNMFLSAFIMVAIPYIIKITLSCSNQVFGFVQGAISFSAILGAISMGFASKKIKIENIYILLLGCGVLFIPIAISISPILINLNFIFSLSIIIFSASLIMMLCSILSIFLLSVIQKQTPNEIMGKVMSILFAASTCAIPLGQVVYGKLLDGFSSNVYITVFIAGVFIMIVAICGKFLLRTSENF